MRSMLPESTPLLVAACVILAVAAGVVGLDLLVFRRCLFLSALEAADPPKSVCSSPDRPIDCVSMVGWRQSDMPERQVRYPSDGAPRFAR